MNSQPLDELYFVWLYSQVADPEVADPSLTHWELLRKLFRTRFICLIEKDENRLEDGKALRYEFVRSGDHEGVDPEWINLDCSVFELMLGLARHMAFLAEGKPPYWFWELMENIGLRRYTDDRRISETRVELVLDRVMYRKYNPNGLGGFFPLRHPNKDQRGVELWYQMGFYIVELDE